MPRRVVPLAESDIRRAKPREKAYKLFDGRGLYLEVLPTGRRVWRWKYRIDSREKRLTLGQYPETSIKEARRLAEEARGTLEHGIDPSAARQAEKARIRALNERTFEAVARQWMDEHLPGKSRKHQARVRLALERDTFPHLGRRPVSQVTAAEIRDVVMRVHARGITDSAIRTQQYIGQVMRYAVALGYATHDPTAALRGHLPPHRTQHMPAPTDPAQVGEILRVLDSYHERCRGGGQVVGAALRLLPYIFVRPGELRAMRWEDVNLHADQPEWRYTAGKTDTQHIVPLSRQAVAILRALHPVTSRLPGGWVFPGGRSPMRPMSDMAMGAAYRRLGLDTREEITPHGWRAVARTLLHERLGCPPDTIEAQLAHSVPDRLGRAYNRTRHLDQRREMMQHWADYLDGLRSATMIALHQR